MKKFILILFLAAATICPIVGQPISQLASLPMPAVKLAEPRELDSKLMARKMPYLVVTPGKYSADDTTRFPVIYLLHGLTGNHKNWVERTKLLEYATNAGFIVVTPEGGNGWYTDSATVPNEKYESYIVKELIPEIERRYRTISDRDNRFIAGLSMGGYGAVKFGLKYPSTFSVVGSFSGALGATAFNETNAGAIGKSMMPIFGPVDSQTRQSNDIFAIIRNAGPEQIKQFPFIYQSCGTEDFLIQNNRDFVALLMEKKVPHEYRQHPGGHTWDFWDMHVKEFMEIVGRRKK